MIFRVLEIKKIGPDIVHIQTGHPWLNAATAFLPQSCALVSTIHDVITHPGDKPSEKGFFRNLPIKFSKEIIVHGEFLKSQFLKKFHCDPQRVNIIPHGVLKIYTDASESTILEDKNVILFFGRIWDYKGLKYLIEAEPLLRKEIPQIKIIIAGKGDNFKKYEKIMVNKDSFEVHNYHISDEMASEFFQRASVVILPYVEGSQSGIIPIAYLFKKPVVVTNVGSIPEVVKNGVTGLIVSSKNSSELASAIIKLLKNETQKKIMGLNGYKMILEDLSWETIADKTVQVYKKAINIETPRNSY